LLLFILWAVFGQMLQRPERQADSLEHNHFLAFGSVLSCTDLFFRRWFRRQTDNDANDDTKGHLDAYEVVGVY
jgi:hypothetical protein